MLGVVYISMRRKGIQIAFEQYIIKILILTGSGVMAQNV